MNYLENNNIKNIVIDKTIEKLDEYENCKTYACDLYSLLYEGELADGVIYYSTYESKQFIKNNFEDLGEIVEEIKFQLGSENIPDVFNKPDKFVLVIFVEVASYLLGQCKTIDKDWNNEIKLTPQRIAIIKKQLKELKD